ncbi:MAG: DUF123 domain-containing protein, partial [Nitrospinae bacterium]|nr:DUF123 domain-containing protein [Nitrospinota bacterium]
KKAFYFFGQYDECGLVKTLKEKFFLQKEVEKFGSSDCRCKSHLLFSQTPINIQGKM